MTIPAFHGDPALKADCLDRLKRHIASGDLLFEVAVWRDGKGSALGCTIHGDDPKRYAAELGYPLALARVLDPLVVVLTVNKPPSDQPAAFSFALEWLEATPVGADLSSIPGAIAAEMLAHPTLEALSPPDTALGQARVALEAHHRRELNGELVPRDQWAAARAIAVSASDAASDPMVQKAGSVIEALAWPAARSGTILSDALRAWLDTRKAADWREIGWSMEDNGKYFGLIDEIVEETKMQRDSGEQVDIPSIIATREPDLARRFVRVLEHNYLQAGRDFASLVLTKLRAAGAATSNGTNPG